MCSIACVASGERHSRAAVRSGLRRACVRLREEKPMHDWARTRLQELLQGWELETPGCSMRIVTMDSCLGDVREMLQLLPC